MIIKIFQSKIFYGRGFRFWAVIEGFVEYKKITKKYFYIQIKNLQYGTMIEQA